MAFVLVIAGLLMIVTGARGTYAAFGKQVASDVNGQFLYFAAAIGAIGSLGYIESLRTFSRLFMALILIVLVLANGGFFDKLTAALKKGPVAPQAPAGANSTNVAQSSGASAGVGGANGQTLKDSLTKPGGGGFWDYFGIPKSWRPSFAQ